MRDLLQARQQHRIEVMADFHQNALAPPAVLPVELDHGVSGGAGAGEIVEDRSILLRKPPGSNPSRYESTLGYKSSPILRPRFVNHFVPWSPAMYLASSQTVLKVFSDLAFFDLDLPGTLHGSGS